jgi:hypothetical protein
VKLGKIRRVLAKEFARSPAKSGLLLALLPLAAYVVLPLWRTTQPSATGGRARTVPESAVARTEVVPQSRNSGWRRLSDWMEHDRWMSSADLSPRGRDPFQFAPDMALAQDEDIVDEDEVARGSDPGSEGEPSGLVLSATLLGGRTRLATINGRTYRERDALQSEADGTTGRAPWIVSQVASRHVVLAREGKEYMLRLQPASENSGGIFIQRQNRN